MTVCDQCAPQCLNGGLWLEWALGPTTCRQPSLWKEVARETSDGTLARWRVDYIGKGGKHLGHWFGTRIYAAFGMNCGDGGADASTVAERIELDTHDVIVAESAFSESYIDDDNRGIFHNAHEYWASHPDALREPARYCAPRRDEG